VLGTRQIATESTSGAVLGGADPLKIPIDPNGNLVSKAEGSDTWTYEWNARNELTRVLKNGVEQARFAYDPLGRRVEKVAGGVTTSYTHDDIDVLRESRGSSTFKFIHGPAIDEPLAREDGVGALNYYHADALGSVVKRTDQAGAVVHAYRYDVSGNMELGASEPGYAFTGREWDPETRLYYYRARYYEPRISRFVSEDPIGLEDGPNRYAYVSNDPVNVTDPSGLRRTGWPKRPPNGLPPCRRFTWSYFDSPENPLWPCFSLNIVMHEDCTFTTEYEDTGRCSPNPSNTCPVDPQEKDPEPCTAIACK
jgi:RHS repeat-associated protein